MSVINVEFKDLRTTGSITGGSTTLHVADPTGFSVGDQIIVEIGTEAGGGARGTVGCGGTWPQKNYATETELQADTTNPSGQYAWAQDTQDVWKWTTSWTKVSDLNLFWYVNKAIPRSIVARIQSIDGNDFTLYDFKNQGPTAAVATATNANVYYDNAYYFFVNFGDDNIIGLELAGNTLQFPAGTFAFSQRLEFLYHPVDHMTIAGAGMDETVLFSPKGVAGAGLYTPNLEYSTIRDFSIIGSFSGDSGFGLHWKTVGAYQSVTDTNLPQGDLFPRGIFISNKSYNVIHDCRATNCWQQAIGFQNSQHCYGYNLEIYQTVPLRSYVQWLYEMAGCDDCLIENSKIVCTYWTPGIEIFDCGNCTYRNMTGVNVCATSNSCTGWTYENLHLTFTTGCGDYALEPAGGVWSIGAGMWNGGIQTRTLRDLSAGGRLINPIFIAEGPIITSTGYVNTGMIVDGIAPDTGAPNIQLLGNYPNACNLAGSVTIPDLTGSVGGVMINIDNQGVPVLVDGIRVSGGRAGAPQILSLFDTSTVRNSVFDRITTSPGWTDNTNNQNNADFEAAYPTWHGANCWMREVKIIKTHLTPPS